jgi:hypothetical protein
MSLDLGKIKSELDSVVNEATSVLDLVEKYAATVQKIANLVPGIGPELSSVLGLVDVVDKALHELQNVLKSV